MSVVLNDEQQMLQASAGEFLAERAPVTAFRELRGSGQGWSGDLWSELAELGWPGTAIDESHGGSGLGIRGLGVVLMEMGRHLSAAPLAGTAGVAVSALAASAEAMQAELLPAIAAGDLSVAVAVNEGPHFDPFTTDTTLTKAGDGWSLSGEKQFVPDGLSADRMLVLCRAPEGGLSLALVGGNEGVVRQRQSLMDRREYAKVTLDGAACIPLWTGDEPGTEQTLQVLRVGGVLTACEMYGCAREAFDRTVQYLKERRQFGAPIGSFQALQHRAAQAWCELELLKSVLIDALQAADERPADLAMAAIHSKCMANDTASLVAREAIQMHGGIAITDELDIGLYFKRIKVLSQQYGASAYHRRRSAEMLGI